MVWGTGLSGSIPLAAAGQKGIPLESTMLSTNNLIIAGTLLVLIPMLAGLLVPSDEELIGYQGVDTADTEVEEQISPAIRNIALLLGLLSGIGMLTWLLSAGITGASRVIYAAIDAILVGVVVHRGITVIALPRKQTDDELTPAKRLEQHWSLVLIPTAMGLGWLQYEVLRQEFGLSFNNLNFAFLFLGLLFQGSIPRYVTAVADGAKGCAGIILQFPFYFGILGIMIATGLGAVVAAGMASLAGESTYPVVTYLSAGLVNLVVPSGGGQWVVQGTIVLEGAAAFPEVIPKAILALAFGDAWTNMLQPFWAVPLLAITGLRARDIIGYTGAIMLIGGSITILLLLLLPS
jgi:short subunit fatty acids transporter